MSEDIPLPFNLPAVARKKVSAAFDGGRITSDGGVMLLAQAERRLGIADRLAAVIPDGRDADRVVHLLPDSSLRVCSSAQVMIFVILFSCLSRGPDDQGLSCGPGSPSNGKALSDGGLKAAETGEKKGRGHRRAGAVRSGAGLRFWRTAEGPLPDEGGDLA